MDLRPLVLAPNYAMNDNFSTNTWVKTSQTLGTQVLVVRRSYTPVGYALDIANRLQLRCRA